MYCIPIAVFIILKFLSSIYGAPVTTTVHPADVSGGRFGNFFQGSKLGFGAHANVFSMANPLYGTEIVAAKCPKNQYGASDETNMFLNEKKIYQKIKENGGHPNVVQMLAIQEAPGPRRFFFKLYDSSLLDHLNAKKKWFPAVPFDLPAVFTGCKILTQLLDGLEFVHKLDIVHRDINLGNVMISKGNHHHIVLIDFGNAKQRNPGEMLGIIIGGFFDNDFIVDWDGDQLFLTEIAHGIDNGVIEGHIRSYRKP